MKRVILMLVLICSGTGAYACDKMDLDGKTFTVQQGGQFLLTFNLMQIDRKVTGTVGMRDANGDVTGTASNRSVDLIVKWGDGRIGRYKWSIDRNGRMKNGIAIDQKDTNSMAALQSEANFCSEE